MVKKLILGFLEATIRGRPDRGNMILLSTKQKVANKIEQGGGKCDNCLKLY